MAYQVLVVDDEKLIVKGIKFSLPLATVSFGIFYFISAFGGNLLMGGF